MSKTFYLNTKDDNNFYKELSTEVFTNKIKIKNLKEIKNVKLYNLVYQGYIKQVKTNLNNASLKDFNGNNLIIFELDSQEYHIISIKKENLNEPFFGLNPTFIRVIGHFIKL